MALVKGGWYLRGTCMLPNAKTLHGSRGVLYTFRGDIFRVLEPSEIVVAGEAAVGLTGTWGLAGRVMPAAERGCPSFAAPHHDKAVPLCNHVTTFALHNICTIASILTKAVTLSCKHEQALVMTHPTKSSSLVEYEPNWVGCDPPAKPPLLICRVPGRPRGSPYPMPLGCGSLRCARMLLLPL